MNTKFLNNKTIALASAMVVCASIGLAQAPQSSPGAGQSTTRTPGMDSSQMSNMSANGQASPADKMFVGKALQGGMAEVQLGQLTLQKSSNEQVKQFAQKMIDDHTKMGDKMKPVAQQIGVPVPMKVSKKDGKEMAKLQGLSGPAYDHEYIQVMLKDHKQDLSDFQTEASSGQDQTVKDAASQGSQVISQHLQIVQQLAKDQNITTAGQ